MPRAFAALALLGNDSSPDGSTAPLRTAAVGLVEASGTTHCTLIVVVVALVATAAVDQVVNDAINPLHQTNKNPAGRCQRVCYL